MVPRAPHVVAPPPVFKPDLLSREASRWISTRVPRQSPSIGFMAQPTNRSPLGFEVQTKKTVAVILRPKPGNPPAPWFWGSTKKLTANFEAKPGKTVTTSFEAKLEKTVATDFEAKPEKTVAAGFEAKSLETVATGF
jgi:hypothetical protein